MRETLPAVHAPLAATSVKILYVNKTTFLPSIFVLFSRQLSLPRLIPKLRILLHRLQPPRDDERIEPHRRADLEERDFLRLHQFVDMPLRHLQDLGQLADIHRGFENAKPPLDRHAAMIPRPLCAAPTAGSLWAVYGRIRRERPRNRPRDANHALRANPATTRHLRYFMQKLSYHKHA